MKLNADVVIVGSGVAGLFSALNLPEEQEIILITKSDLESSDSFLAQGGICVLRDEKDYDSYFEDTMKAGHYENRKESVDIMIRNSRDIINDLVKYGVEFEKKDGKFAYTREGAHSQPRILFYKDITGKSMTRFYRPPQGKYSTENLQMAKDMGYHTFFWSLAYVDWLADAQPSKEEAFDKLLGRIHPGAIVLLHNTSRTNGEILDELLAKWEEMGYTFSTLKKLVRNT